MRHTVWGNIWWLALLLAVAPASQAQLDRDWKIFVVPFSHVDVGFTAPVETVINQQSTYLDSVVSYVERYKSNPEDARFRWSTEITWPLEDYLETRSPEQIERFMGLVREGYIDIGALHFSFQTDLAGPEELVRSLYFANDVSRQYNVHSGPAVINDTPGFTWSLAQLLNRAEVPYLSLAMNSPLSDFYTTTDIPNLFFWEAQSGHRTLVWRSMNPQWAYLEGIVWGLYGGYTNMENRITAQLNSLAAAGYPYDFVMINAATGDNGAPNPSILGNVQQWNDNHSSSEMRVATFSDFFRHVYYESGARESIPVLSGDAPNWWSLWFASSATKGHLTSRRAQVLLPAAETAASIAGVLNPAFDYPKEALDRAYVDNLLYEDHNMGAAAGGTDTNENFWELKTGWVNAALGTAEEVFEAGLTSWGEQIATSGSVEIAVFNVLPWMRSEVVRFPDDDPLLADIRAFEIVNDSTGEFIPHQRLSTGEIAFLADSVPSLGYRTYRIAEHTGPIQAPSPLAGSVLENDFYRIEIGETGGALSVLDKDLGREWATGDQRLNQYRYSGGGIPSLSVASSDSGEVMQRIVMEGGAPGSDSYRTEVLLPAGQKRLDFLNTYDKRPPVGSPPFSFETVDYFFDFDAPNASLRYEIPFGHVRVFEDELSGFRVKHYESQRWSTVTDAGGTMVLSSSGPGLHAYSSGTFGGKIRFLTSWDGQGSYRAGVGNLDAGFSLTSHDGPFDPELATRAGYGFSVPLAARLLPRNQQGTLETGVYSFLDIRGGTLQLSTLKKWNDAGPWTDGDGLVARLYNPSPEPVEVELVFDGLEPYVYEADLLERLVLLVKTGSRVSVTFGPYEVKTLVLGVYLSSGTDRDLQVVGQPFLERPYPNPFSGDVNLNYVTGAVGSVRLTVHDVLGRNVTTIVDNQAVGSGRHTVRWNGRDASNVEVAAGVYLVRLEARGADGSLLQRTRTVTRIR